MAIIEVSHVSKSFGPIKAVDDVSFIVEPGEIFGLVGPNGAGKTTILRLILDIFKPDDGEISILGGPMDEAKKERIGYMPEERGLYQDAKLERVLVYLASLKGMDTKRARQSVREYLERFDLAAYRRKQVKSLSKGMQQKAQLIATLVHEPELIIVDEPFSGLDPVNTQLIKGLLLDLRKRGAAIIMSTHQMHQVEELCDRILLINRGGVVLYGHLKSIRKEFAGDAILVRADDQELGSLPGVVEIEPHNGDLKLTLSPGASPQQVLNELIARGGSLEKFEVSLPTLDEIFVQVVQEDPQETA